MSCNKCKYLHQIVNLANIEKKKTYYSRPNQDFEAIDKVTKHCVYVFLAFAANCKSCKFMCILVFKQHFRKKNTYCHLPRSDGNMGTTPHGFLMAHRSIKDAFANHMHLMQIVAPNRQFSENREKNILQSSQPRFLSY